MSKKVRYFLERVSAWKDIRNGSGTKPSGAGAVAIRFFLSISFYYQVEKMLLTILSAEEDRETRSTRAVHNGESTSELNAEYKI